MNRQLDNWIAVNAITLQFLDSIPEDKYHDRAFPGRFRTLAWEFACIFTTREMYINGYACSKFDGNTPQSDEKRIESLSWREMKKLLDESDKKIRAIISKESKIINYFGENYQTTDFISYLLQHEQLHFGKLILMFAQLDFKIPEKIKEIWGHQSFASKRQ